MAQEVKSWPTGGNVTLTYPGQGDGPVTIQSDDNPTDEARSMTVTIVTTAGSPVQSKTITVTQAAGPNFRLAGGGILRMADGSYLNVAIPNS
jgi:hypothetical protein